MFTRLIPKAWFWPYLNKLILAAYLFIGCQYYFLVKFVIKIKARIEIYRKVGVLMKARDWAGKTDKKKVWLLLI